MSGLVSIRPEGACQLSVVDRIQALGAGFFVSGVKIERAHVGPVSPGRRMAAGEGRSDVEDDELEAFFGKLGLPGSATVGILIGKPPELP
ncbi:hypothetical protein AQPW35_47190 [Rubrivivax pictus]|jgi:hypothetical protein|uniref:Uncharacterized protein n=1 Tax=Pseudaquabacterium pictum TaxID=2315236 RepID=A0A480B3K2_9BURK|nr:hypothetical protein AQPW35_47190 [Rubrivivax pictus]